MSASDKNRLVETILDDSDEDQEHRRFLYVGDTHLVIENTLNILDAAKTYAVQGLVDKCLNLLKSNMTVDSVCRVMEIAHINQNEELRHRCLNYILREPSKVLVTDSVAELCSDCLSLVLEDDQLSMDEESVFFAVSKYAELKCRASSLEETGNNKRAFLGDTLGQVRFPCMSKDFFSEIVQPSGLLTDSECIKVYKYFINPENGCELFITTPRSLQLKVSRFLEFAKGWGYKRDKQDVITFQCSHDIVVHGLELFATSEDSAKYEVTVELKQLPFNATVQKKYAIVETHAKDQTYKFLFDQACIIAKYTDYAISLICRGPPSHYGVKGLNMAEEDGVTFRFKRNERSTNNTTVERGQIASILYRLSGVHAPN